MLGDKRGPPVPPQQPDSRGPVPEPYSKTHAAKLEEVSRRGGSLGFAHDAGMVYSSPEWLVLGTVTDSRQVLPKLLEARKLLHNKESAAETCADFWLAYMANGALVEKPEMWDKSSVLQKYVWSGPSFAVLPHEKYPDKSICRLTYWRRENKVSGGAHAHVSNHHHGPARLGVVKKEEPLKEWSCWEFCYAEFNLDILRTGTYDDEKPGYCYGSGRVSKKQNTREWVAAFKTARDGMSLWTERDESFDMY